MVDWEPDRLYAELIPDPEERAFFLSNVCTMAWHAAHDAGEPMRENARDLIAAWPRYADAIRAWDLRWADMFDGYVAGTEGLLVRLDDAGWPLFALSNLPAEKKPHILSTFPVTSRFADIIVSGEEKVIKPDPRIFKIACARLGRAASDIIFIDDMPANVDAGRAAGMDAILFQSAVQLEADLAARGVVA